MTEILDALLEPLSYGFAQRSLLALILVGFLSAVVGSFMVVRGLAFFGDALAHAVLPGVAVAYTTGGNLFVGGLGAGILAALTIVFMTRDRKVKEDTAIGIVFVTMFALGIAIISIRPSYGLDLAHILFGSISGIDDTDLTYMVLLGGLVLLSILVFYKQLIIVCFDPELGQVLRLPVAFLRALLLVLVAVTIVLSLRAVGLALMLALLLTPAATARLLTKRMSHMVWLAGLLGCAGGVMGFYLSWWTNVPPGSAIVLELSAVFGLVYAGRALRQRRRRTGPGVPSMPGR
ncbi:MAG: metal ABC transporter permease [Anaerolineaceae bacterium]|nr:metal ABC transporter permease [Anaerolineaceae bacterium]MDE0328611.1 metal ABC transporter permease [Anaerolineaceae bacterium]